jgi:hypothetical protein
LEPEKETSLPARNRLSPLALFGSLVSVFLFGWLYSKSRTPDDKTHETISPLDRPASQAQSGQSRTVRPLVIDSSIDPGQSNKGSKRNTPVWEKAAVLVALGVLIVNYFQMRSTEKAAAAAKEGAEIARDTLMRSQRPWLVNDGPASVAIDKVSNDSISGEFTFTLKNLGPSPALVVGEEIRPFARTFQEKADVFEEARRAACQEADTKASIAGDSIFPQQTHSYTTSGAFFVSGITPKYGTVLISGCIAYRDQFDTTRTTHHTTFCLMTDIKTPAKLFLCGNNERAA